MEITTRMKCALVGACAGILFALGVPGLAQEPPAQLQAVLHEGRPALRGESQKGGWETFIDYIVYGGEPAFRFLVRHQPANGWGVLWISRTRIAYDPVFTLEYQRDAFNVLRSQTKEAYCSQGTAIRVRTPARKYNFWLVYFRDSERTEASYVYPEVIISFCMGILSNFEAAEKEFRRLTRDVYVPIQRATLSAEQTTQVGQARAAGEAAEQAGQLRQALDDYAAALRALPDWPPLEIDHPLREGLFRVVNRLDPPPAIPEEARRHAAYAMAAFEDAQSPGDFDPAIAEWKEALKAAPWWHDAYFNLALVLEKRAHFAEAARYLQLYLLAKPDAPDADAVRQKMYALEYKAKKQAGE